MNILKYSSLHLSKAQHSTLTIKGLCGYNCEYGIGVWWSDYLVSYGHRESHTWCLVVRLSSQLWSQGITHLLPMAL